MDSDQERDTRPGARADGQVVDEPAGLGRDDLRAANGMPVEEASDAGDHADDLPGTELPDPEDRV